MLLSNITDSLTRGVSLSVGFDKPEDYFIFIFQILFATATVMIAGTVVIGILATRALRLQNRFIFMLNTSIADTLVGLSVYYLGLFDVQDGNGSKNGTYGVLTSLLGVNILTFMFAQFDRYFAVCHPFIYSRFITRPCVICINVFSWVYTYGHLISRIILPPNKAIQMYLISNVMFQLIVLVKVIMTLKLYLIARYQLARDPPSAEKESKKESLRIIIFVVISFLVLWSPPLFHMTVKLMAAGGLTFRNEATNPFAIMSRFSALCTPSVYIWGSPTLREAIKKTVWGKVCLKCRRR